MESRLDETGFGQVKILQNPEEFCYGVDAVLLADMASKEINQKNQSRVIDLGTGTGIVPLILSHKTKAGYIAGVELQEHSYNTALKNIKLNGLEGRLDFLQADVHDIAMKKSKEPELGTFDVVTTNPPYTENQGGLTSKNKAKAIARHETTASLEDFVKASAGLLRDKGDFYMVHRPSRLVDICYLCRKYKLEPKELQFISGKPLEKPNIILVHCVKNGNRELKLMNPLFVHNEDGGYSREILEIYEK